MKIAVISDIHGNMEAVNAVMEDINKQECKTIFILGDYAMAGPEPDKTIKYFINKSQDSNVHMIQGNTDLMIANYSSVLYEKLKQAAPVMAEALKNDTELINPIERNFLKNLPIQKEVEIEGVKFLLVHGSPRKNDENIFPDTPIKEVEEMLKNVNADVVLCGHTHIPCGFQTESKKTVVNAGSIGRSFFKQGNNEQPKSCYLVINVENGACTFEHRFVKYDTKTAYNKILSRDFEGADKLAQVLLNPEIRHF